VVGLPYAILGNGFEIPPLTSPLPCFPGFSWASQVRANKSEHYAIEAANSVSRRMRTRSIVALRDIFDCRLRLLATLPELDHYGARCGENYIGMLRGSLVGSQVSWPREGRKKVFVYLRPDTPLAAELLAHLSQIDVAAVCVLPGFALKSLGSCLGPRMMVSNSPVSLSPIIQEADLCLSYGAEGTVALTVLQGIPQLLVPRLVESYMTARRVVEAGAGLLVERSNRRSNLATSLDQILSESSYVKAARHLTSAAAELRGDAAAGLAMKHLSVVLGDVGGRVTYGSPA
jgi:hypothetical protein